VLFWAGRIRVRVYYKSIYCFGGFANASRRSAVDQMTMKVTSAGGESCALACVPPDSTKA
jgi:hypothetical protein